MTEKRKWLDEHNIQYSQTDIKKTLLQLVDVENEYFEKDGSVEDVVEEMIIAVGDDSDEEVEEEDDMVDDDDRQLIGMTLRQSTSTDGQSTSTNGQSTPTRQSTFTDRQSTSTGQSTPTQTTCTNPRQNLSELLQQYDPHFLEATSGMIPSPHCCLPGPAP